MMALTHPQLQPTTGVATDHTNNTAMWTAHNDPSHTGSDNMDELVEISLDVEALEGIAGPRRDKLPLWLRLKQWEQRNQKILIPLVMAGIIAAFGLTLLIAHLTRQDQSDQS